MDSSLSKQEALPVTTGPPACAAGSNLSSSNLINISAVLFMWTTLPAFGAASYVPAIVLERPLFVRERSDGLYRVITYLCAKMVEELFLALLISIAFCESAGSVLSTRAHAVLTCHSLLTARLGPFCSQPGLLDAAAPGQLGPLLAHLPLHPLHRHRAGLLCGRTLAQHGRGQRRAAGLRRDAPLLCWLPDPLGFHQGLLDLVCMPLPTASPVWWRDV